jgi:predicted PurR-regulated permease PerM
MRQNPQPQQASGEVKTLESQIIGLAQGQLQQHYGDLAKVVPQVVVKVLSASQNVIYLVIIPILSFLILRDGRNIRDSFIEMLDSGKDTARELLADAHELLLLYMRALLFLCCATLITFSIVLSAMGVHYALLLASIAFPLEFIPLVGPLVAAGIIIAVSIVTGFPHVWWVVVFLGCYRMFQDYVLSPHLMSQGIELHPLLIIFGVLAGGEIGGVAGVFLSMPVLALVRLLYYQLSKVQAKRRVRAVA